MEAVDTTPALLPCPRRFDRQPGVCDLQHGLSVSGDGDGGRIVAAVDRLLDELNAGGKLRQAPTKAARVPLHITLPAADLPHPDGHRLTVRRDRIELWAASPAACFHGLQTLRQLWQDRASTGHIACCEIVDWPDFITRGLLCDVTRGRVPKLETLKHLADRLAALKCNQLQLNIEHAFVFSFDPEICRPDDGLTPDEVRDLDEYCRDRFIDLVPALATFGHMGRVLSMPRYRHLAEIEATTTWDRMSWPQRVRGFTLDCANPEAHRLVEHLWSDALDAFTAPIVNICGDEPHDLGMGKNRERLAGRIGEAYLDQIRRTHEICNRRGRHVQFWSDVVRNHPDLFHQVPKDATVMHWGYDDNADYEGTKALVDAGLDVIVCPGTSGWKRILNGMNLAERNISAFAEAGKRHGASGLVNTDWGDHGHFNMPGCSWHGIALGASKAWRADHPIGDEFDRLFAARILGVEDESVVRLLREAARSGDTCETWRQLWMPADAPADDSSVPSPEMLTRLHDAAGRACDALNSLRQDESALETDLDELELACHLLQTWARKMTCLGPDIHQHIDATPRPSLEQANTRYRALWLQRHKPSGLDDIDRALRAAADCETMFARRAARGEG